MRIVLASSNSHNTDHERRRYSLSLHFPVTEFKIQFAKRDKVFWTRPIHYLKYACFLLFRLQRGDIVWAWGLDSAVVASAILWWRRSVFIIWDISDLHGLQLKQSWRGFALRAAERIAIRRANTLVLSSGGFLDRYYSKMPLPKNIHIVENLVDPRVEPLRRGTAPLSAPARIIYAGIFRSESLLRLIKETVTSEPGLCEFILYGAPERSIDANVLRDTASTPGVAFRGVYKDSDLARVYREGDFVFGLTDTNGSDNEVFLLPNRLYHAGFFGIPLLATSGSHTAKCAEERRLGLSIPNNARVLIETIKSHLSDGGRLYQSLVEAMPPPDSFQHSQEYIPVVHDTIRR